MYWECRESPHSYFSMFNLFTPNSPNPNALLPLFSFILLILENEYKHWCYGYVDVPTTPHWAHNRGMLIRKRMKRSCIFYFDLVLVFDVTLLDVTSRFRRQFWISILSTTTTLGTPKIVTVVVSWLLFRGTFTH